MATFREIADLYADMIQKAVAQDHIVKAAGMLNEDRRVASANLADTLKTVGQSLARLTYAETKEVLSDEDQQAITDHVAERLGIQDPKRLRLIFKEASVNQQLKVVTDIRKHD